jgi:tetratricopeptide (TPR) repeat protein
MDRALGLVRDLPPSPAKAEVLVERSRLSMLAGEYENSIQLGEEALALAEALGLERLQASALVTAGTALGNTGEIERGIEQIERGLELALRLKEPQHVYRGYNNIAQLRSKAGEYRSVLELNRAAQRFVREYGLPGGLRWLGAQEAVVAFSTGDWVTAERVCEEFLETVDAGAPHYMEGSSRLVRAQLRHARGDVAAALDEAKRSVALGRRAADPQALGLALATHAFLLLEEGHEGDATAITDELDGVRSGEGGFAYFSWIVCLAWLAHDLDRPQSFREPAENETLKTPWIEAGHAIVDGEFARAADVLERMGLLTDEAYARLRAAEHLAAQGMTAEAAEQRDRALAFYRSVGATTYVRRAEALLLASA